MTVKLGVSLDVAKHVEEIKKKQRDLLHTANNIHTLCDLINEYVQKMDHRIETIEHRIDKAPIVLIQAEKEK